MGRLSATVRFLGHLAKDLAGTLASRWRRFHRRIVLGEPVAVVGVDVFPFFERMTGVGRYAWNLLAALDARDGDGLEFNLYGRTFLAPEEPAPPAMPGRRRMRLRVHHLPEGFLFPVRPAMAFLDGVVEPLLRILDGNDVLFAPNFFAHRTQLPYGRTVVATIHDLAFRAMPDTVAPETLGELARNLGPSLYRSERIVAVSEATAGDVVQCLGVPRRRIHTVHEGIDPAFCSEPGTLPEGVPGRYLLFVSTLEPRKNVANVLRAFRLMVEWGYPGALVLVGRWGWRTGAIRRELENSPVRDRIVHLDYVEQAALPALYGDAEALIFPSLLEGFGLPILEAMACGTPVVTAGRSAMPEVAGPAAVYVDPESPHGIATGVLALVRDPEHRRRLGEAGRERAAMFSWERAAAATAQVLRQAAGLPPTGPDEYRV